MKLGIIGCGKRARGLLRILLGFDRGVELTAVADINPEGVKQELEKMGLSCNTAAFYTSAEEMLDRESLDGVIIGTRCSTHARLACKVIESGVPLFLEKPVGINMDDIKMLQHYHEKYDTPVVVSFPLRLSDLVRLAREIVESNKLGEIQHVQAVNNVPYGGTYYHRWYRDESETGGLWLQKATHDFDYINYLVGQKPVMIAVMESKQIFRGDKPAGLYCVDCDEYYTCPESTYVFKHFKNEPIKGEQCCFAVDTGNHDSGSALVRYENGMHLSYSQNFFARKKAAARGARLLGYNGTLEFDWYQNELRVFMHDSGRVELYKLSSTGSHHGGDEALMLNFIDVMSGERESESPLSAGILSAYMCIKARESCQTNTFVPLHWPSMSDQ